ncbi:MAG TPA: T9SS type A sorting domain-containing protein, partial [Bacteroidia bacterium]|nr:T9SS type A sorting domain-containing protein [Bacteroidia bacterium]
EDVSGLTAGTYSVTITDANGCSTSSSFTLTEPAVLASSGVAATYVCGTNVSCNGANDGSIDLTVTGGATCAAYTYNWSNGATTEDVSGLTAGTYSVTITDANGCSTSSSFTLTEPALLTSSGVAATYVCGTNVSCNGANDGSINLTVSGGASCVAYTYAWSNGATTEDVSGLTAGTYSVTITDANGCSTSSSFALTEPALLTSSGVAATYVCGTNVSCNGAADGSINLTVSGGASCVAYTFNWSNGATTEDVSGLTAGTYSVTITDANGCSTSSSFTLTEPTLLTSSGIAATYVGGYNIRCHGENNGSIDLTANGGASCVAYNFNWSNGATTEDVSGLTAGTYSVTVTDANGCTTVSTFTLTEPAPVVSDAGPDQCILFGYTTNNCATLVGTQTGGVAPYTVSWNIGSSTGTLVSNSSTVTVCPSVTTTYCYTVTDANGCTYTDCMVVNATDIRCGQNLQKITICHTPPGNGGNPQTICVAPNAVGQHIPGHTGDYLGACGAVSPCTNLKTNEPSSAAAAQDGGEAELAAFPNPFSSMTTVRFTLPQDGAAELRVYSMTGEEVAVLFDGIAEANRSYEVEWKASGVAQGIYFAKLITSNGTVMTKKLVLNN